MTHQPFDKQTPPLVTAEVPTVSVNLDLNRGRNEPPPHFVELADKLYDAALEAAKRQVIRAEALVRKIEIEAEQARTKAKQLHDECQRMERDLEDLSSDMLQCFGRYNGGGK
jgi:hypothetical protein